MKLLEWLKSWHLLIGIGLILTLINIDKAYHIDDAFHLQVAEHLKDHPTKPLSGEVLWDNKVKKIAQSNQPPLYFYLLALVMNLFGENALILHLFTSAFVFPSLFFFKQISSIIKAKQPNLMLIIFGFSYPIIINQNIMVDVPLLAMMLGSIYFFLLALERNDSKVFLSSMIFLSIGLLIKYTIIPLIVAFVLILLLKKQYKNILFLMIPLFILGLWSLWNYIEVGQSHIGHRESSGFNYLKFDPYYIIGFISCLGSMALITPLYLKHKKSRLLIQFAKYLFLIFFFCLIGYGVYLFQFKIQNSIDLSIPFIIIGTTFLIVFFSQFIEEFKSKISSISHELALAIIAISLALFIILYAPFIASRHLLLVLPLTLLAMHEKLPKKLSLADQCIVCMHVIIGLWLGFSDKVYASFYQKQAKRIKSEFEGHFFSCGFWGWQWYSKKNGMTLYQDKEFKIRKGDLFCIPQKVPHQSVRADVGLSRLKKFFEEPQLISILSGNHNFGLYWSDHKHSAWAIRYAPIDTIVVHEVVDGISLDDLFIRIKYYRFWYDEALNEAERFDVPLDTAFRRVAMRKYELIK